MNMAFNTCSNPSQLKITDIRFADIVGAPMHCTLMKIETNQGIVGLCEVRDGATRTYAELLKSRLLGENPCDVDRLFRRIKQFGYHARQGGGVSGVEVALWDLAGKAYGVPVYRMLGGRFRDRIRVYCDTDVGGRDTGITMGNALKLRMERGFTFLKMDLGIGQLRDEPSALCTLDGSPYDPIPGDDTLSEYRRRNISYEKQNVAHPFTGIHVTEHGFDVLEQYVKDVRSVIGYEVPLAIDHFGHICVEDCIKLAHRLEKYNLAWLEDMVPWQYTEQYVRLRNATTIPVCTGEDIYLSENFEPLLKAGGVSVIHPDVLTVGGILELKKTGDLALKYGVAMAVHMAESPIACMAAAHACTSSENFLALEYHSADNDWWDDLVVGRSEPIVQNGWIRVDDAPGLGIEDLNDEVIAQHLHPAYPEIWASTEQWNTSVANDRLWS